MCGWWQVHSFHICWWAFDIWFLLPSPYGPTVFQYDLSTTILFCSFIMMVSVSPFPSYSRISSVVRYNSSISSSSYTIVGMYSCTNEILNHICLNFKSIDLVITHNLYSNTSHCAFLHYYCYASFSPFTLWIIHYIITTFYFTMSLLLPSAFYAISCLLDSRSLHFTFRA